MLETSRISMIEMDDSPSVETIEAPIVRPIEMDMRPTVETHDREANGSTFRENATSGHGLTARASGQIRTSADLLVGADLAWHPEKVPLVAVIDGTPRPVKGKHAIVRSDTRAPVGIVGDRYVPIAHEPLFKLGDAIVGASEGALRFGNAGHKRGGSVVFAQLQCDDKSPAGDVRRMISLFTSHDGSILATAGFSTCVIVCRNTYSHALGDVSSGLRIRHTANAESMIAQIDAIARMSCEHAQAFDNAALRMMGERFSDPQAAALASALIPGESKRGENARGEFLTAYQSAPGAMPGTVWGAAQAVTWYSSHELGSAESRAESAIFGSGTAADFQKSAFAWLEMPADTRAAQLATIKVLRA